MKVLFALIMMGVAAASPISEDVVCDVCVEGYGVLDDLLSDSVVVGLCYALY